MMAQYTHCLVVRHPKENICELAEKVVATLPRQVPVLNAGDGTGEHPTQALLDLYTIREKLSSIHGKTIAIVGDLKNGRTGKALINIMSRFSNLENSC
jgi:aspartate carbamoyltransferase catalytic subunit